MANNNENLSFDEGKARELVYFLLESDTNIFKKLIPDVKSLNSEAFEKLFQGIPYKKNNDEKDGYDYNVRNKKMFERLLDKFDNFYVILDSWYKDEKYHQYLKEIWKKYISIENLRGKDDRELEKIFKLNHIDDSNWPEDIKEEFKILIRSTKDTRVIKLKNIINNEFSEFNIIIEKLIVFKETIKDIPDINNYEINSENIINNMLNEVIIPIAWCSSNEKGGIHINNNSLEIPEKKELSNQLLEQIKGQKEYNQNPPKDTINELKDKCTDKKIDNLDISQKVKSFLKNKWVCSLHAVLSFLNLGYNIYELTQTYKSLSDLKEFKKRLIAIKTNFSMHQKEIGILPDDFEKSVKKINEVFDKIQQDQKELQNLIKDILMSIKYQEVQQEKATSGLISSIALGTFGIVGGFVTSNGGAVVYGMSTIANIISTVISGVNLLKSKDIVKDLNIVLDEAKNLNKEIQEEIDKLIIKIKIRMEEKPKFDVY